MKNSQKLQQIIYKKFLYITNLPNNTITIPQNYKTKKNYKTNYKKEKIYTIIKKLKNNKL